ncbi:MAG: DUF3365 domain-containing protein [Desulfarculus sp.]|nr:DUF3365 domain-containing protein [Desulfarculus sp.]
MKARNAMLLAVVLVFACAAGALLWLVRDLLGQEALREAESEARHMLERNLAIHSYFAHQLKPKVFELLDKSPDPQYFEPAWMSSTYAIRGIDQHYQALAKDGFYYKECAINARSPRNEADDHERAFIEEMKADPGLDQRTAIRVLDGQPYFVYLRRGEAMEKSCLRCHSQPELAPRGMVEQYGPLRSFQRQEGELVSAVSIRVPLATALAGNRDFALKLSGLLLVGLAGIIATLLLLHRLWFQRPLEAMRQHARAIADDPHNLGRQIPPMGLKEWNDLAWDFNRMSLSLKASHEQLEERVSQRTAELEAKTRELQESLTQVKILSGLLPICAHCKKIRDDQGYWRQLENYIRDHSQAEFTHGICPQCAAELYAELMDKPDQGDGKA